MLQFIDPYIATATHDPPPAITTHRQSSSPQLRRRILYHSGGRGPQNVLQFIDPYTATATHHPPPATTTHRQSSSPQLRRRSSLDGFLNGSRAEERTHPHCECQHLQAVPFVHHRRSVVSHPRARQRVDRADVTLRSLRRPSILPSHSRRVVGFNVDQGKQVNEHSPFSFSPLTSVCET